MATIGFFLVMKGFLSIACNCNPFISLGMKMFRMLFFLCNNKWIQHSATRSQDWNRVYARKIYPSEVGMNWKFWIFSCMRKVVKQYLNPSPERTNLPLLFHYLQFVQIHLSIVLNWSLDVGTQLLFFISFLFLGLSVDRS